MTTSEKTYRSDALTAVHETASDLHGAGTMDDRTLQRFNMLYLDLRAAGRLATSATDIGKHR